MYTNRNSFIGFLLVFLSGIAFGQSTDPKGTLHTLFMALHDADPTPLDSILSINFRYIQAPNNTHLGNQYANKEDFSSGVAGFLPGQYYEKIWNYDIKKDGNLASAWLPYSFYNQGVFLHCGTNHVELIYQDSRWQITQITDTHNSQCDYETEKNALDKWMNDWHKAAAEADEETFFTKMSPTGIYLGTDASEKWFSDEMKKWSQEYFDRESAWSFTATSREWYFAANKQVAWFDEIIDTWMGECRGSGVLTFENGEWKMEQYNLAILVPNDKVKEYLELMKKKD